MKIVQQKNGNNKNVNVMNEKKVKKEQKVTLKPMFKRVIVQVEDENPHRREKTESGIYIPETKLIKSAMAPEENGLVSGGDQRIKFATVMAVADDCVSGVKPGDEMVVDSFAGFPVAIGIPDLIIIPEGAIQYVIKYEDAE